MVAIETRVRVHRLLLSWADNRREGGCSEMAVGFWAVKLNVSARRIDEKVVALWLFLITVAVASCCRRGQLLPGPHGLIQWRTEKGVPEGARGSAEERERPFSCAAVKTPEGE